ncbi:FAD-binding oxidoreductase [Subtercola lobariae]|uniref:FAD-binding protein n=1 Tax=Subtercola lobariae TaxID=1588641 RepID=A0A917ETX9_9MICO|nr:FAD-binding oxidoreductase [Subtercola lobariae]GGF15577.1 FAD-binding protein [Subtercola lobariae]
MSVLDGLTGRVVVPGDDEYDSARASWNLLFSHRPIAIVYAQVTADVVNAVTAARRNDVPLRVRSGGHSLEGWSTLDDGLVIDVSELASVSIDVEGRTATLGAGLTQAQAVAALGAVGLAAPTGTEGSVGLVGATLGGGFGLLTRAFGMASDNLLAAEVVVPCDGENGSDAEVITADASQHSDLLWALRGAGNGSFGVVTSLTFAVHPLADVTSITVTWQGLDDLAAVFEAWQATAPVADERLTSQLEIQRDSIVLFAVLASSDGDDGLRMLAPLIAIGSPEVAMSHASWADTYSEFQIPLDDEPANWKFNSQFVSTPFPAEAIEIIGRFVARAPTAHCNYFTNAFGGAVAHDEPAGGSVFAHRDALFYAEPGAGWGVRGSVAPGEVLAADDPLMAACLTWVAEFSAALAPFVNGAYSNVPNADAADWATDYWGFGVDRLRAVKTAYDPTDVFSFAQGIAPRRDPSA